MKTLTIIAAILFCFGCATAPSRPNALYLHNEIMAGRMNAEGVNQAYDDYQAARKEYEQTASYKASVFCIGALATAGSLVGGAPTCGTYRGYGGRATITTVPIGGGAYRTVISGY